MTAPARNLPARQSANDVESSSASIGLLPPDLQQALQLRKLRNQVAGQLAAQNWGKSLDLETRRAIADWGQQFRVDVTTEIHVLGGNVYLNAAFWLRQLSEMIEAGIVEYAYADHVEDDPRLKQLGAEGEGEYSRRLRERIMHGLPDKAAAAVIFRIKLRSMDKEITGAKACGNGVKKNDPVGDAAPIETCESRAARRAMRMIASHVPRAVADDVERINESASELTDRIKQARAAFAISEASHRRAPVLMAGSTEPYETDDARQSPQEAQRVTPPPRTEAQRHAAVQAASGADPYAEDSSDTGDGRDARDAGDVAGKHTGPAAFVMPFAMGGAAKGVALSSVSTKDLGDSIRFAADVEKYATFVEMATEVLEQRRLESEASE